MRLYKLFLLLVITLYCMVSCSATHPHSKKEFRTGVNILYGEISTEDLFSEYPAWKELYDKYIPNRDILSSLAPLTDGIEIQIYFGTWCGDSRREVPKFLKIVDICNCIDKSKVRLWAVDRNKELESGLHAEKNIKRVATFIFLRDGVEIGRIVERTKSGNLEQDIYEILKGQ